VSRKESSTGTEEHSFEYICREPVAFSEPTMFLVDEVQLHKYLAFELERLSKLDKTA